MALLEKQLFIKRSTIPKSGKGLFTKKFIPRGTRIVEYKGKITRWKEVKDEDGNNPYIFYVKRDHVVDALPTRKALARYANDANGLVRVKGVTNNCDYITDGLKPYIESKKDIPAGSEILVDYGKDYWNVIRENLKLERAAEKARKKKAQRNKAKRVNEQKREAQKILKDVKVSKDRDGKPSFKDMTRKTRRKKAVRVRKSISKGPSKQKALAR